MFEYQLEGNEIVITRIPCYVKNLQIPDQIDGVPVTKIGKMHSSSMVTKVKIPDSVTKIGSGAFSDCSLLTEIKIPDSVTSIGSKACSGCVSLT